MLNRATKQTMQVTSEADTDRVRIKVWEFFIPTPAILNLENLSGTITHSDPMIIYQLVLPVATHVRKTQRQITCQTVKQRLANPERTEPFGMCFLASEELSQN